jgi:DNA polymerase I-like protein with 3'-5' exonuclease and polymerase domains
MFKLPYDDVPKNDFDEHDKPTIRYISKRCRHGLNYRMGPAKLASETGLSLPEAEKAYRLYHNNTPELRRWWNRTEREVRQTRELYNSFGTRLRIMGRIDEGSLDSIIAFYPQSTIGVKVWSVIFQSQEDAEWPQDSAVVMNIHDALIALAPYDSAKKCAAIMKKHAEMPINVDGTDVIIPADIAISVPDKFGVHRWSTLEKE